ncbi:MAG: thioredoxin family protein [bacterium]|nr:thioredoxin family protein [bacterium]
MKKIEVFGSGCARCERTVEVILKTATELGLQRDTDFQFGKITDIAEMAKRGVLATPGVAIDGKIVSTGRIPKPDEIELWLR